MVIYWLHLIRAIVNKKKMSLQTRIYTAFHFHCTAPVAMW